MTLQVVGDEQIVKSELPAAEGGPALADSELACSDDEWEILQTGWQGVWAVPESWDIDQCCDLDVESGQQCCKGVPTTLAATMLVGQQPEETTDVRIAAAMLHNISVLVSLGYSKDHAETALVAVDDDVTEAIMRLLCTSELFSSYDRELIIHVLAEQGDDVECALAVLRRMSELAQAYHEGNLNKNIPPHTISKMRLAIAELGLQFEEAGDTAISSASKALDRAQQVINEVSRRAFAGVQPVRRWLSNG